MTISLSHHQRFEAIKRALTVLGPKESNFLQVETLFYEALTISRAYGEQIAENALLANFKRLQAGEYQKTKIATVKALHREQHIRRFMMKFKQALSV